MHLTVEVPDDVVVSPLQAPSKLRSGSFKQTREENEGKQKEKKTQTKKSQFCSIS
jgi:hypothetical protein